MSFADEDDIESDSDMSIESESDCEPYPEIGAYEHSSEEEEEGCQEKPDQIQSTSEPPLYVLPPSSELYVSNITKADHVMAVGAFATRHNLSNVAISDLLSLIQMHIPGANTGVSSVKTLKEECGFDKMYLKYNLFCSVCKKLSQNTEDLCQTPGCRGSENTKKYFVTSSITSQLKELLERPGIWKSILESKTSPDSENLSDIKSGSEYQKLKHAGGFLDNTNNITLSMFTDGVALFKSSSVSLWPVYLLINELPPKERFLRKNLILWGIWQGTGKPNMVSFLKPLIEDLNDLYKEGFSFNFNGKCIQSKAMLTILTMDLQARAYVLNMTHHNGEFGCLFCNQMGERVPSGDGTCRSYRYLEDTDLRTEEDIRKNASEARMTAQRKKGFWGENVFLYLSYFSIINSFVIDYMHGALLGVTKKLLEIWFESKFSSKDWYIGQHLKEIDRLLQRITPPYFIHRRPRAITKTYYHWKASELRSWLLFYSLPCLAPYLQNVYLLHFSCLVEGIYILLGEGICPEALARANLLLCKFVKNMEILYGPEFMSMNVHSLLHLTTVVKRWGPLWGYSCFPYESFNGEIMSSIHGTGNVCRDIFWHLQAQKRIETKMMNMPDKSEVKQAVANMISRKNKREYGNAKQCHVVNAELLKHFNDCEENFLQQEFDSAEPKDFRTGLKIIHNGFAMYSSMSKKVKQQNSYTILLQNGTVMVVDRYIVKISSGQVFASGKLAKFSDYLLPNRVPHIRKLTIDKPEVVKVTSLREPLVVVKVGNDVYAALVPNHYERD